MADPLVIERGESLDGLEFVRQPPPAGSASFAATYVAPAGWAYDPPGVEGTALLTGSLITSAAGRYNRVALARELDRLGANLTRHSAPESTEVGIWGPATEWERLLVLLAEVVIRPRFDPDDVERVMRQLHERQLREASQPGSRAEREFLRSVFPAGHPYRETGLGTRATTRRIDRSRIVRFHQEHFSSEGALLVVTAPASLPRVRSAAGRVFRGFPSSKPPPTPEWRPPRGAQPTVKIAMAGRSQVELRLGGPTLARSAPEYPALYLANEILGGRPLLSRLFQRVRERHGLAYHASSEISAMRWGGYWVAEAGTGADRWKKVVPMIRGEVNRLVRDPVSKEELDHLRESAIGEIPLALETTSGAHELAVDVAYHRLPANFYRTWPETLRSIRPAEIRSAAEAYLSLEAASTVLAGPVG